MAGDPLYPQSRSEGSQCWDSWENHRNGSDLPPVSSGLRTVGSPGLRDLSGGDAQAIATSDGSSRAKADGAERTQPRQPRTSLWGQPTTWWGPRAGDGAQRVPPSLPGGGIESVGTDTTLGTALVLNHGGVQARPPLQSGSCWEHPQAGATLWAVGALQKEMGHRTGHLQFGLQTSPCHLPAPGTGPRAGEDLGAGSSSITLLPCLAGCPCWGSSLPRGPGEPPRLGMACGMVRAAGLQPGSRPRAALVPGCQVGTSGALPGQIVGHVDNILANLCYLEPVGVYLGVFVPCIPPGGSPRSGPWCAPQKGKPGLGPCCSPPARGGLQGASSVPACARGKAGFCQSSPPAFGVCWELQPAPRDTQPSTAGCFSPDRCPLPR